MFKATSDEVTRLKETVAEIRLAYPIGNWELISQTLNTIFVDEGTPEQWRKRYYYWTQDRKSSKERATRNTMKANGLTDKSAQLRKMLQNRKTIEKVMGVLEVDKYTALGMIQELQTLGYAVNYDEPSKTYGYAKNIIDKSREYHHSVGNVQSFELLIVSDTHLCAKDQQISFLNYCYDLAQKRGITQAYHVGDLVDGYYSNRPEQIFNLFKLGADEQTEYCVQNYPQRDGITTYIIGGNHDETFIKSNGYNIVKTVCAQRDDMEYLGLGYAKVWLTPNCRMDLFHPLDGSSYAISYSTQKYIDSITGGDKPNILLVGHHHKALQFLYRNIHAFEVPACAKLSAWQRRVRQLNVTGAWILKINIDDEGTVTSINAELIPQYNVIENDF